MLWIGAYAIVSGGLLIALGVTLRNRTRERGRGGGPHEYAPVGIRDIGFDAVNAGPLKNARRLEALGYLNIQLGYVVGKGVKIGFRLVH